MRRFSTLWLILCSLSLGACGSNTTVVTETTSQTKPGPASSSGATGASASISTSSGTSASTSAAGSTSAAALPRCRASSLHGSFLGQQGAAGHGELGFALRNASGQSCHTVGFPGVQFLSTGGAPLPTHSVRTTHDLFGSAPLAGLDLAPGASASFRLGVGHGLASSAGCATAATLAVIAPDDMVTLRIPIPGGAYECTDATVSPLRPGTSAFP